MIPAARSIYQEEGTVCPVGLRSQLLSLFDNTGRILERINLIKGCEIY